jgi:hypothetical protein
VEDDSGSRSGSLRASLELQSGEDAEELVAEIDLSTGPLRLRKVENTFVDGATHRHLLRRFVDVPPLKTEQLAEAHSRTGGSREERGSSGDRQRRSRGGEVAEIV